MMGKDPGSRIEPGSIDACFGIFNYFGTLFCSAGGAFLFLIGLNLMPSLRSSKGNNVRAAGKM